MKFKETSKTEKVIALINLDTTSTDIIESCDLGEIKFEQFNIRAILNLFDRKRKSNIIAVIAQSEVSGPLCVEILESMEKAKMRDVPFFLFSHNINKKIVAEAIESGITDIFQIPLEKIKIEGRINFTLKHWETLNVVRKVAKNNGFKLPVKKRIFDIAVSLAALIVLSPVFLVLMILLKLESKGNIFYYSLRVGSGYKIFKFYKFRSMYSGAEKRLKDLKHLNQYKSSTTEISSVEKHEDGLCRDCRKDGSACRKQLFTDVESWCEKQYLYSQKEQNKASFYKIKDDPRVTPIGKVIRNLSLDELPQLWNVLKGDMSIVGNRPLPLYEAEKLTTDNNAQRFMAAAGITGLWQVEKRGKGSMSEEERLLLDNLYSNTHSFKNDITLILKTIPALFQKENV